jgi:hypothetical protein
MKATHGRAWIGAVMIRRLIDGDRFLAGIVVRQTSGGLIFPQDGAFIQVVSHTHVRSIGMPARKNNPKRKEGARQRFKLDEKKANDKEYLKRKLREGQALGLT